jgi:hypothetical protein
MKAKVWLVGLIAIAGYFIYQGVEAANTRMQDEIYINDDRVSDGEKGWDLEIFDGKDRIFCFYFLDELVRYNGPKTPDAPKGWKFKRQIHVLSYGCDLMEAAERFISAIDQNNPDFKFVRGRNSPSEPRHFTVEVYDPQTGDEALTIVFVGNRADISTRNGYTMTGNTETFLRAFSQEIERRKIVEG